MRYVSNLNFPIIFLKPAFLKYVTIGCVNIKDVKAEFIKKTDLKPAKKDGNFDEENSIETLGRYRRNLDDYGPALGVLIIKSLMKA